MCFQLVAVHPDHIQFAAFIYPQVANRLAFTQGKIMLGTGIGGIDLITEPVCTPLQQVNIVVCPRLVLDRRNVMQVMGGMIGGDASTGVCVE